MSVRQGVLGRCRISAAPAEFEAPDVVWPCVTRSTGADVRCRALTRRASARNQRPENGWLGSGDRDGAFHPFLAVALDLQSRGIRVLLVERNPTSTRHPKMDVTNGRTMEYFRRLGIAERIRDAAVPQVDVRRAVRIGRRREVRERVIPRRGRGISSGRREAVDHSPAACMIQPESRHPNRRRPYRTRYAARRHPVRLRSAAPRLAETRRAAARQARVSQATLRPERPERPEASACPGATVARPSA